MQCFKSSKIICSWLTHSTFAHSTFLLQVTEQWLSFSNSKNTNAGKFPGTIIYLKRKFIWMQMVNISLKTLSLKRNSHTKLKVNFFPHAWLIICIIFLHYSLCILFHIFNKPVQYWFWSNRKKLRVKKQAQICSLN